MTALQKMTFTSPCTLPSLFLLVALTALVSTRTAYPTEREWHDALWFAKSGDTQDQRNLASVQIADGKLVIRFGSRSDVDPEELPAEANQGFTLSDYRLFWSDKWPAVIRVEVRQRPADRPPEIKTYFLPVVDPQTGPRLELTTDNSKAARWTMESIRTVDRVKTEAPYLAHWGYIRVTDIPGPDLWLGISSDPILKNEPPFRKGFNIRVVDYRQLSVSPKKEHLFHFARSIPDGK